LKTYRNWLIKTVTLLP